MPAKAIGVLIWWRQRSNTINWLEWWIHMLLLLLWLQLKCRRLRLVVQLRMHKCSLLLLLLFLALYAYRLLAAICCISAGVGISAATKSGWLCVWCGIYPRFTHCSGQLWRLWPVPALKCARYQTYQLHAAKVACFVQIWGSYFETIFNHVIILFWKKDTKIDL